MKQAISTDQLKVLMNQSKWKNCKQQCPREFFVKKDVYYSFNGEMLSNPKRVVRIRRNDFLFGLAVDAALECETQLGRWIKDEAQKPSFQIFNETYKYKKDELDSFVSEKFFDFSIQHTSSGCSADLTIKNKNTDSSGVETNDEREAAIGEGAIPVIEELLKTTNFYPYFKKEKRSVGWYVILDGLSLHLEVVNVNNTLPYLEIETILADDWKSDVEKNEAIQKAQDTIKKFFWENLGIVSFDGRSWNQIINAK